MQKRGRSRSPSFNRPSVPRQALTSVYIKGNKKVKIKKKERNKKLNKSHEKEVIDVPGNF